MNPYSLPQIRAAFSTEHEQFAAFLRALPLQTFLNPLQGTWSPLQHLQHLMASEGAFTAGLAGRRFKPLETPGQSRSYAEVAEAYEMALQAAPAAALQNNPFSPPEYGALDMLEATRGLALSEWGASAAALLTALEGYRDSELDALSGRHPLLGWISLREFLLFMIYHPPHHRAALERRMAL